MSDSNLEIAKRMKRRGDHKEGVVVTSISRITGKIVQSVTTHVGGKEVTVHKYGNKAQVFVDDDETGTTDVYYLDKK